LTRGKRPAGVTHYFRPWIAMAAAHVKAEAAIITRNGFTVDLAITNPSSPDWRGCSVFVTNVF
jgi:hypothetical protein